MDYTTRRQFLKRGGLVYLSGALLLRHPLFAASPEDRGAMAQEKEEEVTPNEDLMREHGLLKRVLLAYQEIIDRVDLQADFPPDAVVDSAGIIRSFVEDYHEQIEENYLFPRFKKANTLVDLVNTLTLQHRRGRILTDRVTALSKNGFKTTGDTRQLRNYLHSFIRMYSPHEAREDTVLFPAFKKIVSPNEYDSLGEAFEDEEHEKFGADGFEVMLDKVVAVEKRLGIYELDQFTPEV